MSNTALHEIAAAIASKQSFSVISHASPDADAYGSISAVAQVLRAMGKDVRLINESGILPQYSFIPLVGEITTEWPTTPDEVLIICDCGEEKRIGDRLFNSKPSYGLEINIDHHQSNNSFGQLNYVRTTASSTAEMVYDLILALAQEVDQGMATALLSGIMGDTGSFNFPNTSPEVLEIAARLVRAGASPSYISGNLFYSDSLNRVLCKSEALAKVEVSAEGKIALAVVDQALLDRFSLQSSDLEGLVDQVRRIAGVQIAVLVYRDLKIWKVSLRSKDNKTDLSLVAKDFGGGGHKQAAAFRSTAELSEIKARLLQRLEQELV
jgi:phosphoesterase RecJ-like protein